MVGCLFRTQDVALLAVSWSPMSAEVVDLMDDFLEGGRPEFIVIDGNCVDRMVARLVELIGR